MTKKATIRAAVKEQCWLTNIGRKYDSPCYIKWCNNTITVFDFQCGHDIPESKGGTLDLDNLKPICSRCNASMSDDYTIQEWQQLATNKKKKHWCRFRCL
jgi:hypothetical protein|tara:strand:- start:272 stop:571 length:300 start_codon:yes stop_codon:yes gene_type:complete